MDMETLWTETCELLQQEIARVSYDTWIGDNLIPSRLEGDCLILTVKMEPMRDFVVRQYQKTIDKCLTQAANRPFRAELLTREEIEQKTSGENRQEEHNTAPRLNPKYTFDRFVVGSSNRFAQAASLPQRHIIRCSYTAAWASEKRTLCRRSGILFMKKTRTRRSCT